MNLVELTARSGVVGCGGAGFPTHAKLAAQGVDTLIINGAECEPLLRTDRWLMRNKPAEILTAVEAARAQLGAQRAVIALKESYIDEIAALEAAAFGDNSQISLHFLQSFYPAGDEQVLVYEVTGRVTPPAGIPLDVGCVVCNAATMFAVYQAMQGRPFTQKYLTVTGAVASPCVVKAPLGTSFADCLALAGGALEDDYIVVSGGPMMGQPMEKLLANSEHVAKTTSGYLVLPSRVRLYQNFTASPMSRGTGPVPRVFNAAFARSFARAGCWGTPLNPTKSCAALPAACPWRSSWRTRCCARRNIAANAVCVS